MPIRFIHTADIHLGKTYRGSPGEKERFEDFFACLSGIVADAVREEVDFVLIAGDLFHTGQILPRTFARTIEVLQPLKTAGIPCIAIEGNHDWIHRRDNISWMEALSQMGYIRLLRPERTDEGGYRFAPFDSEEGAGGHVEIGGLNIYGLGYIGAHAGSQVPRICEAVATEDNILLFHVGVWSYTPVEIGKMQPQEAAPLADTFGYVALGHGHKPYVIETDGGRPYAFNPGAPECVNFGEETYDKGYYLVTVDGSTFNHEFRPTAPRPMLSLAIDLGGAAHASVAIDRFAGEAAAALGVPGEETRPLLQVKLYGKVGFHPFELGRGQILAALEEIASPLHVEIRNQLSLAAGAAEGEGAAHRSLAEIEREVLEELIGTGSAYQGSEPELAKLAMAIRERVLKGDAEGEDLLEMLTDAFEEPQDGA
ncbi:MAG: exonuclease SbcCD subunit D [Desulfuromonas sp.]|uniref:metallophosphoesterase family protein n=1 Tax=Desulfuromonas sp. TaxID=892 RepID=UPI000CC60753|nr:exonuclease SbcCD subunit D [Desulfuromonas sp.]PLX82382.1 MAG: exonuclease SbcCD subunit D [Desulfuromonas sp.]